MDNNSCFRPPWQSSQMAPWERKDALQLPPLDISAKERRKQRISRLRTDKRVVMSTILTFLLGTGGLVASYANYTATATNPGSAPYNQFSTGTVALADNDSGSALFSIGGIDPPYTGSACIGVQYTGTITHGSTANGSYVYLYAATSGESNSLGTHITMAVQDGTDSSGYAADTSCTGFTANADSTAASHATTGNAITATALDSWPTTDAAGYSLSSVGSGGPTQLWSANPTTVWYKFTYNVPLGSPASSTIQIQFIWEADGQ